MADVNANIGVNIDTTQALAQLKSLQRQISQFHTSIAKSSETAALAQRDLQRNFINSINSLGAFSAELRTVKTTSESFTDSLEKNKFSMREYFRYAGGATKTFGRLFRSEFDTIGKVAEDRVKRLQTQYIKLGRDTTGAMKAIAVIPNELDLNNWSTRTQLAAQRQAIFNQLVRQGSTNLLNFGKNTQWAGRQLMVGFTLPLATLGTTASRVFMEMEAAALKFRKVYGDLFTPREETQQALADITALGQMFTRYGISVASTVGLAAEAAAAGFQGVDLQRQTTQATRLSVLGQVEQQKALETTISLQNAFKMSSEDLAGAIDFLNAVENQTVVSLDDITTAIPKVAPVIQQLGGDVKDLAFFMAAMKEGGVNASEGANALKSGLASLINPTEKASGILADMGINIKQIIEVNKGDLKATVIAFAQALDTLDPLTRARAIEQLFGKFQFARLSTLFDNVTNQTGQAARVLDLAGTSIEDLAALSEQELGMTADSAMNKFRKSVEDLKMTLVPVGQTFLEAVTPIVEFIGGILEKFNNLSSGVKKAIVVLTVAIGAIGPVALMTFGLLANGLANIVKGAMILRNGYLRLTGQTQILGEQTDYLTTEQMNAAAVAHSLDQSHAKLTQTFTAEANAIAQLIQAYDAAARAGARFAATNPGMMVPPRGRGYASGVVSVPGPKGAGDVVPAMLSPGEAVIPADMAKRYAPLIQGMIAGNIPGYQRGLPGNADFAHITSRQTVEIGKLLTMLEQAPKTMSQSMMMTLRELAQVFGNELKTFVYSGLGFTQSKQMNIAMAGDKPVSASQFLQDFDTQGIQKWNKSLSIAGVKIESVSDELTAYDTKLRDAVSSLLEFDNNATITSTQFAAIEREVRSTLPEFSQLRQALNSAEAALTEIRFNLSESQARAAGLEPYQVPSQKFPGQMSRKKKVALPSGRTVRLGGEHFVGRTYGGMTGGIDVSRIASRQAAEVANQTVLATAQAAQTQSPSKRTIPIGEDIARGLQVGMANQTDETTAAGANLANAAVSGTQSGGRRGNRRAVRPQGPPSATVSQIVNQSAMGAATKQALDNEIAARKTMQQRLSSMNNVLMSGTFALTSLAGAGSFASGTLGDLSQQIFKYSGLLFGLMSITQLLTQAKITELAATRMSAAKQAMAFATYGTGIKASKGLFGSLARLGIGITRFLGPVGLVATGLTAMYGGVKLVNSIREKERMAIEGLGDAALLTGNKLKTLGDFFGVVPSATPLERTGPSLIVNQQTRTELDRLRADEGFLKEFSKDIESLSKASNEQAELIFNSLAVQLKGKGFAKEQVTTIIKALQEESGKINLNLDFANIDLTTPQGKEELKNNLKLMGESLGKEFATGYTSEVRTAQSYATGEIVTWTNETMSKELKKTVSTTSKVIAGMLNGISGQLANGTINAKEFDESFGAISDTIKGMPEPQAMMVLSEVLKNLPGELAKSAAGLKNTSDQLLIVEAAMIGVTTITPVMIAALDTASKSLDGGAQRAASRVRAAIRSEIKSLKELRDIVAKELGTGTGTGTEKGPTAKERYDKAYGIIKNFFDSQEALIRQQRQKEADLLKAKIDNAQAAVDAAQDEINAKQDLIDINDREIDLLKRRIELEFDRPIDDLRDESNILNNNLEIIGRQEKAINEQYDAQTKALEKISSLNQEIANSEKSRLTIADALTAGNIAEAARAAQEARDQAAQAATERQSGIIDAARQQALAGVTVGGMTREQIEARQYQISQQTFALEQQRKVLQDQITVIQDKNYAIEQQIYKVKQDSLIPSQKIVDDTTKTLENYNKTTDKIVESITYLGQTAEQWEKNRVKVEAANAQLELTKGILKEARTAAQQIFEAWDKIKSKVITITTVYQTVGAPAAKTPTKTGGGLMYGGKVLPMSMGGMVPKYFANGGKMGSDTVPAMLTPGEFVVNKKATQQFGPFLKSLNESKYPSMIGRDTGSNVPVVAMSTNSTDNSNTVYNYNVGITVGGTNANPDRIAKAVLNEIKYVDSQRIRNQRA